MILRKSKLVALTALLPLALACGDEIDAGSDGIDAGTDDDPLVFDDPAPAGSLESLQRDIIQERCSGEPGLCHNGQFEPNLSTTANTYAWMVRRPAIENFDKLRVNPGDPDNSFLIDKIRDRNVGTQMPLGAEPLTEEEIGRFEAWIESGALRAPGAEPPAVLNNPPKTPEVAAFDGNTKLSGVGNFVVPQGVPITMRHTVEDFETDDPDIFVAGVILGTSAGANVEAPGGGDFFQTTFDGVAPPMGQSGDLLNYTVDITFGATIDLVGQPGVSTAGLTFTPIVIYVDNDFANGGIIALLLPTTTFTVQ